MGKRNTVSGGVVLLVVAVVVATGAPGAMGSQTTSIEQCQTIEQSGTYELAGSLSVSETETCLKVQADDVVIEGNGNAIDGGEPSRGTIGVHLTGSANVELRNVVVTGWGTGVKTDYLSDGTVTGVTAADNTIGVEISSSDGVTVDGVTARSNARWGLALRRSTTGTTVTGGVLAENGRDLYVQAGGGNEIDAVSLGESAATETRFSASMIRDINIKGVDGIPPSPDGEQSIDRGVAISPLSPNAGLALELHYEDRDVDQLSESSLAVWGYSDGSWETVGGTVDTDANSVRVPIDNTDFPDRTNRFALFGNNGGSSSQTDTRTPTDTETDTPTRTPRPTDTNTRTSVSTDTESGAAGDEGTLTGTAVMEGSTSRSTSSDDESDDGAESVGLSEEPVENATDATAGTEGGGAPESDPSNSGVSPSILWVPVIALLFPLAGVVAVAAVIRRSDTYGHEFDEILAGIMPSSDQESSDEDDDGDDEPTGDVVRGVRDLTNCPNCGGIVGTNEDFCTDCGTQLSADSANGANETAQTGSPVPSSLTLSIGGNEFTVDDGSSIDEELRALLRDGGRGNQAKWIDDDHLQFRHTADEFVLTTNGDNLTRINGDRLRPDEETPVEAGDTIEVSGFLRLSVEE